MNTLGDQTDGVISYDPKEEDDFSKEGQGINKWWITVFNPDYNNVKPENLSATFTIDFSNQTDLYDDFIESDDYLSAKEKWSVDEDNKYILTYIMKKEI